MIPSADTAREITLLHLPLTKVQLMRAEPYINQIADRIEEHAGKGLYTYYGCNIEFSREDYNDGIHNVVRKALLDAGYNVSVYLHSITVNHTTVTFDIDWIKD